MSVVDEIKQQLDIVDFINGYVPLKKAGRNYKGLCPFHTEKTPSFVVFPDSQSWHCFGACSTGGDIFEFAMRRENLDFREALSLLAERAGVDLQPLQDIDREQQDELSRLRDINSAAAQYYHRILLESPAAAATRAYLERRGVTRETMVAFQLGYALDEWHALESHLPFDRQDLVAAGLLSEGEHGNIYDRFRGRLMFPIRDVRGHVVGFGGRVLDDSVPKYLNTPATPLFDKGSVLYGIDLARQAIRDSGTAILVEGYMDVIILHQCGVQNAVAVMGTALTEAHLKMLRRITKKLIFALDPDQAGLLAVERGVEVAREGLEHKVVPIPGARGMVRYERQLEAEIRILTLPDGLDPDELILEDRARWDRLVADARPVADYFFELAFAGADLESAKSKRAVAERLLPVIAAMDSPVERSHYLQRLAQRLRTDERDLLPDLGRLRGTKDSGGGPPRRIAAPPAPARQRPAAEPALGLEERCVALILNELSLLAEVVEVGGLSGDVFQDVRNRQVFEVLQTAKDSILDDPEQAFGALDTELRAHVESLLHRLRSGPTLTREQAEEDAIKCATRLRKSHLSRLIGELRFVQQDAQEQGDSARVKELNQMMERLRQEYLQIDHTSYAVTLVGRRKARENSEPLRRV
jgi:DNA primase